MKKDAAKLTELENRWKIALADYQNLQRRYEAEKKDFVDFASANLIIRLLVVLDHLKIASHHQPGDGLALAIKEFEKVLTDEGLVEIQAVDQPFDPNLMEAIELVSGDKDKVAEIVQTGYTLKGRLLRPAKVKVGKG